MANPSFEKKLNLTTPIQANKGLSNWSIIAIVVAVTTIFGVLLFIMCKFLLKKRNTYPGQDENPVLLELELQTLEEMEIDDSSHEGSTTSSEISDIES